MALIKRGALIVIEGVDKSGKSTQCRNLVKSLNENNIKTELINFPNRTTAIGKVIDEYLKRRADDAALNDHAIHLLFTANRWECIDKMTKLLYEGTTLVVDRYSYSGIVYSAIKQNMDIDWCKQPENGLIKPDLVFWLTLDCETMARRPGFGNERYEDVFVQKQVAEMFAKISRDEDNWQAVDASSSIDDVGRQLLGETLAVVKRVEITPLKNLNFNKR